MPILWKVVAWAAGALAFAAAIAGGIWWIYTTGRDAGVSETKAHYEQMIAEAQAAAKVELERRVREYDRIVEQANDQATAAENHAKQMQETIDAYTAALQSRPGCALTPDDLRALERLRPR